MNDDARIRYINTDLDIEGGSDIVELVEHFRVSGFYDLAVHEGGDEHEWSAHFEADDEDEVLTDPEKCLTAFLTLIESLEAPRRAIWDSCTVRRLDVAFSSGVAPFGFRAAISHETISRLAAVGAMLQITVYPPD